ncbi:helix-turn-helix domain-containing protein [Streptomyces sp. MS1.HAVA.3]|uniref:Helix-turn-helix domain-containing protein n=1 Tax=Streptomyces caledonius TaxID=3134107 RepID=A0ABU8U9H9_9ACTN
MTNSPDFGMVLGRLLDRRGVGVQDLADLAGVTADEIRAVLARETPGEGLLRRLATALGFQAVDLFALAGVEVPEDWRRWTPRPPHGFRTS